MRHASQGLVLSASVHVNTFLIAKRFEVFDSMKYVGGLLELELPRWR